MAEPSVINDLWIVSVIVIVAVTVHVRLRDRGKAGYRKFVQVKKLLVFQHKFI